MKVTMKRSESLCRTSAEPLPQTTTSVLLKKSKADLFSLLTGRVLLERFCLEKHKVEGSSGFFFSELLVGFIPGFIVLSRQCLGFILHVFSGRQKNEWLLRPAARTHRCWMGVTAPSAPSAPSARLHQSERPILSQGIQLSLM